MFKSAILTTGVWINPKLWAFRKDEFRTGPIVKSISFGPFEIRFRDTERKEEKEFLGRYILKFNKYFEERKAKIEEMKNQAKKRKRK